jgi:hypothetical protein
MKEINVSSWDECRQKLDEIIKSLTLKNDNEADIIPDVYYRGQADADWRLETTLERYNPSVSWMLTDYLSLALRCAARIESFTDKRWHLPNNKSIKERLNTHNTQHISTIIPCFEFLVYLRHHGFPSPLLDWTRSPYIATFFAFGEQNEAEKAAVFAYIEIPSTLKDINEGGPNIEVFDSK